MKTRMKPTHIRGVMPPGRQLSINIQMLAAKRRTNASKPTAKGIFSEVKMTENSKAPT